MRPDHIITKPIEYIRTLFAREDVKLEEIRNYLINEDIPIQIGAEEGKLLQLIIQMAGVKNIVEIGTLAGYSTLWMARALPDDGKIITIERDEKRYLKSREFLKDESKIIQYHGNALEILTQIAGTADFDMVFIDADKNNYMNYLLWAKHHLTDGGLVIADNVFLFGAVYEQELPEGVKASTRKIMQEFNEYLANNFTSVIIPTLEGLMIARK